MKTLFYIFFSLLLCFPVFSQDTFSVSDYDSNAAYSALSIVNRQADDAADILFYQALKDLVSGDHSLSDDTDFKVIKTGALQETTPTGAPTTPPADTTPPDTDGDGVSDLPPTEDGGGTSTVAPGPYISSVNVRGHVGTKDDERYMSFNLSGSANVMVRAVGPFLGDLGLENVMVDPNMRLTQFKDATDLTAGSDAITEGDNDNYTTSSEKSTIETEGANLNPVITLKDVESAAYLSLESGYYSSQVFDNSYSAENGSRIGWVGVDMIGSDGSARFTSVSARGVVKPGDGAMFGGFEILGDTSETRKIFIRGRGPSFTGLLDGLLSDPQFQLFKFTDEARTISELVKMSDNYIDESNAAEIASKATSILGIDLDEKEPGVIVDLSPGYYTIQFESVDGASGIGWIGIDDITE